MSTKITVPAELRDDAGKGASRRLRRTGMVPGILYGADKKPVPLAVEHNFLVHAASNETFHSSVLDLQVGKKKQKVVLRDLQRHPHKLQVMHVDFLRIDDKQVLRIDVPIHFVNEEKSPAGKAAGVVVSHRVTEVEVAALPKDLPEYIEVELSELEPGESVMLSELKLPEGVTLPALEVSEENDTQIVSAIYIRAGQGSGELAAQADAALAESAEPELADEAEAGQAAEAGGDEKAGEADAEEAKDE